MTRDSNRIGARSVRGRARQRTGPRFFLSHNFEDKSLVLRVDRALKSLHIDSWVDKFEIRAGDSLLTKVFDEGLQTSDYVCAFVSKNSQESKWVREELEFAFLRSLSDGKPRIIVLRFDKAVVPSFLQTRRYLDLERQELGAIVQGIMDSANIKMRYTAKDPEPYGTLDFHDALKDGAATYILASRRDALDVDPAFDPEGIEFNRRDLFVLKLDGSNDGLWHHYLSKGRPAHTAMRVIGQQLLIFINDKVVSQQFTMTGRMFHLAKDTLQPTAVDEVFEGKNWGWDPWIDENGILHHKDFETPGNPYRIGDLVAQGKTWHDLANIERSWRERNCPYPMMHGPSRETGYLRFIDVSPSLLTNAKKRSR